MHVKIYEGISRRHTPPQLPHGLATKDCETVPVEPVRL
jgi:hypothetical protein